MTIRKIISIDVRFSCVCPVIDHEFHHNIVRVSGNLRADSHIDPPIQSHYLESKSHKLQIKPFQEQVH